LHVALATSKHLLSFLSLLSLSSIFNLKSKNVNKTEGEEQIKLSRKESGLELLCLWRTSMGETDREGGERNTLLLIAFEMPEPFDIPSPFMPSPLSPSYQNKNIPNNRVDESSCKLTIFRLNPIPTLTPPS
jgi:hypothetical protein